MLVEENTEGTAMESNGGLRKHTASTMEKDGVRFLHLKTEAMRVGPVNDPINGELHPTDS